MSDVVTEVREASILAEQALRALWMFDVTAFESCRCACCGGLRLLDREFAAGGIPPVSEPAAGPSPS